jgi:hypothetical protein
MPIMPNPNARFRTHTQTLRAFLPTTAPASRKEMTPRVVNPFHGVFAHTCAAWAILTPARLAPRQARGAGLECRRREWALTLSVVVVCGGLLVLVR